MFLVSSSIDGLGGCLLTTNKVERKVKIESLLEYINKEGFLNGNNNDSCNWINYNLWHNC